VPHQIGDTFQADAVEILEAKILRAPRFAARRAISLPLRWRLLMFVP
jgi:hypothetical protein